MKVDPKEIVSRGIVRISRQRTDLPFTTDNTTVITEDFDGGAAEMRNAFSRAMDRESREYGLHPFAWNPEFGYITADPCVCGTGLEFSAVFHLEGLHLIGDLEPALNALRALRMYVDSCDGEGIRDAAHMFRVTNAGMLGISEKDLLSRVSRTFAALVEQETNARRRLVDEVPLVFEDAVARALAILRSCVLLSEWELMDAVSPLRLAAQFGFLDNLTLAEAREIMESRLDLPRPYPPGTYAEMVERDRKDADLAKKAHRRFKNVRLNAYAKEYLSS